MNMTAIEQQTRQLARDMQSSDAFRAFEEIYKEVSKEPSLYEEINRVRRAYFQALNQDGAEAVKTAVKEVQEKFADSLSKGYVKDFLEKEQRFCMMVQRVHEIIDEVVNFDMAFIFEDD